MSDIEDTQKTQKKLAALKKEDGKDWIAVDGFLSLMDVDFKSKKEVSFNVGKGYIVKLFVRLSDGEIKMFPSSLFFKDDA